MKKRSIISLIIILVANALLNQSFSQLNYFVGVKVNVVEGTKLNNLLSRDSSVIDASGIQPGDTIFIVSGKRNYLLINNICGTKDKPIVVINSGGQVLIESEVSYYGIAFRGCQFLKLTGTGNENYKYGFKIDGIGGYGSVGVSFECLSSDFEMENVEVSNTNFAGVKAKTDPDTTFTSTRDSFIQYNSIFHDNYIHKTGGEGFYIGNTKYKDGFVLHYQGKDTTVFPHSLVGVKVYNNIVDSTGWDGIQVSSAVSDCQIFSNKISHDSQAQRIYQMSGIMLGNGSRCDCFNNIIDHGTGIGIMMFGLGNIKIFNNLLINTGRNYFPDDITQRVYGMYISDDGMESGASVVILNNTIVEPKGEGIRFVSLLSKNNVAKNNLIINPGSWVEYENDNTSFTAIDAFIHGNIENIDTVGNHYSFDKYKIGFDFTDIENPYKLSVNSNLIDAGFDVSSFGVDFDILNNVRPLGFAYDFGAYESPVFNYDLFPDSTNLYQNYSNPFFDNTMIKYTLDKDSDVKLMVVESGSGKVIQIITDEFQTHGTYRYQFNTMKYSTSSLICVLYVNGKIFSSQMLNIKK